MRTGLPDAKGKIRATLSFQSEIEWAKVSRAALVMCEIEVG